MLPLQALRKVPAINSSWMGDFIRQYNNVDVNVAVQTPVGLMVPFVRDADRKGLQAISADVKELAGKVSSWPSLLQAALAREAISQQQVWWCSCLPW